MAEVTVNLGDRSYPVQVVQRGFERLASQVSSLFGGTKVIVVTEDVVGPLWAEPVLVALRKVGRRVTLLTLPSGEKNKTMATWSSCVDLLLEAEVDRHTPVLALGGGVLGDIVGFDLV